MKIFIFILHKDYIKLILQTNFLNFLRIYTAHKVLFDKFVEIHFSFYQDIFDHYEQLIAIDLSHYSNCLKAVLRMLLLQS